MKRNLSVHRYFEQIGQRHVPKYRFRGSTKEDFEAWRAELLSAVRATLGPMPQAVPLNPEIESEWREEGLIKQRILLDVAEGLSAVALLYRPETAPGRLPAILACHGHGPHAKRAVMGLEPAEMYNAFGLALAKAGFVTVAIDWRGFGERDDNYHGPRDLCNLHFLRASVLGQTLLAMDVHDGLRCIDYLCQQDFVDPGRIGAIGLSFGGTMAMWLALCDDRIRAVDIACYSACFGEFGLRDINFCGSQITPGLFALADVGDLQGLIAPRPLLVEIGTEDRCFPLAEARACHAQVERIYRAAGAAARLELDLFQGEHRWGGSKSIRFFRKYLAQERNA